MLFSSPNESKDDTNKSAKRAHAPQRRIFTKWESFWTQKTAVFLEIKKLKSWVDVQTSRSIFIHFSTTGKALTVTSCSSSLALRRRAWPHRWVTCSDLMRRSCPTALPLNCKHGRITRGMLVKVQSVGTMSALFISSQTCHRWLAWGCGSPSWGMGWAWNTLDTQEFSFL